MRAAFGPVEVEERARAAPRIAAAFAATCVGASSSGRSPVFPLGSPIIPVPPPTSATGRWPARCEVHEPHDRDEAADVQAAARSGRSRCTPRSVRAASASATPSVCWYSRPRQSSSSSSVGRLHGTKIGPRVSNCQATSRRRVGASRGIRNLPASVVRARPPRRTASAESMTSRSPELPPASSHALALLGLALAFVRGVRRRPRSTRAGRSSAAAARCPSVDVARRVPAPADLQAVRRRRPLHRRARARAPHARPARRDSAASCATPSSSPRTSASTSTRASTAIRIPGALCADIKRAAASPRASRRSRCSSRATSSPSASRARRSLVRKLKEAKVARAIEAKYSQGQDPRALPQPDLPRQRRLRRRDGVAALLRQVGARPQRRRGGDARRAAQGTGALQSAPLPRSRRSSGATRSSS